MSAQTKGVDVLEIGVEAAIGNCAHYLREEAGLTAAAEQMEAVLAAIAELIEADREYNKASRAFDDGRYSDWAGISDESRMKICERFEEAAVRRADALAHVGGAQ